MAIVVVTDILTELSKKLPVDTTPAAQIVFRYLAQQTKKNFDLAQSPAGVPWLPLKREKRQPLRKTGLLAASVSAAAASNGVRTIAGEQLIFGSRVPYGIYHQEGTRTIPQRQWLGITEKMVDELTDLLVQHFSKVL